MYEVKLSLRIVEAPTLKELQHLVDSGRAKPSTPVRLAGQKNWLRLEHVPGISFGPTVGVEKRQGASVPASRDREAVEKVVSSSPATDSYGNREYPMLLFYASLMRTLGVLGVAGVAVLGIAVILAHPGLSSGEAAVETAVVSLAALLVLLFALAGYEAAISWLNACRDLHRIASKL